MSLLVVGSIALDTVKTPFGERSDILGGAASFFSVAASFFTPVRLLGVIGDDFPECHVDLLRSRGVDLRGLERRAGGKTFRWSGSYEGRMDTATTRDVKLNVLGDFKPTIPDAYMDSAFVFLANTDPVTQAHVVRQLPGRRFAMLDTMNLWIDTKRDALIEAIRLVDGVVMNDEEARVLGGSSNLIFAMNALSNLGARLIVVKKGEHGAVMLRDGAFFALPAYPLDGVKDPTGAGDTFAAGFMGHLAATGDTSWSNLKKALAYGTVTASFTVEDFSLDRLLAIERADLDRRLSAFISMVTW